MKKNGFVEGAMIATLGIVISRIIGLIYVIPFYSLIGSQGGALYSYAYSIYAIFLSLSSNSIPIAISKLVSEYNSLGYYYTKERVFKLGSKIIIAMSFIFFVVLMLFSKEIAYLIIGDIKGGNTIEGVTTVVRIVATALLIVPFLSVMRGYIQGHKIMTPSSISNVIEQIVRVIVLLLGSYLALKVFHLSLETGVGIAVFGATVGAIAAYLYLVSKISKNKDQLHRGLEATEKEKSITNNELLKKIVFYSLPFILIDLARSSSGMVDTLTVVKTLYNLGFDVKVAETAFGALSTWASKINMIVIAVVLGIDISLIPNLAGSFIKNDFKEVSKQINQSLRLIAYTTIPMAIGLSLLAQPVWVIFYGYNQASTNIFHLFVFQTITYSFFYILIDTMQTMNDTKVALGSLLIGFIAKLLLNVPMMHLCHNLGIDAYYGPIIANLMIQTLTIVGIMYILKNRYNIHYHSTIKNILKSLIGAIAMLAVLLLLNLVFTINATSRLDALIETVVYSLIGVGVYLPVTYKMGLFKEIFGTNSINEILIKLKLRKA
jgi:O-antigen/teichoic acid export membrane protein